MALKGWCMVEEDSPLPHFVPVGVDDNGTRWNPVPNTMYSYRFLGLCGAHVVFSALPDFRFTCPRSYCRRVVRPADEQAVALYYLFGEGEFVKTYEAQR